MQRLGASSSDADASDVSHRQKLFSDLVASLLRDHMQRSGADWDIEDGILYDIPEESKCFHCR
jgi:hypothetical protein